MRGREDALVGGRARIYEEVVSSRGDMDAMDMLRRATLWPAPDKNTFYALLVDEKDTIKHIARSSASFEVRDLLGTSPLSRRSVSAPVLAPLVCMAIR